MIGKTNDRTVYDTDVLIAGGGFARLEARSCFSDGALDETGAALGDAATADLFTEITREIDKQLWFVEAHLEARDLPRK